MRHTYLYARMIKLIFYGILFYMLYKLIFDFIIPVSKASNQIRSKMKEAQERQQEYYRQHQQPEQPEERKASPASDAEYIDFEEIK